MSCIIEQKYDSPYHGAKIAALYVSNRAIQYENKRYIPKITTVRKVSN